jgi:hypothetical protein
MTEIPITLMDVSTAVKNLVSRRMLSAEMVSSIKIMKNVMMEMESTEMVVTTFVNQNESLLSKSRKTMWITMASHHQRSSRMTNQTNLNLEYKETPNTQYPYSDMDLQKTKMLSDEILQIAKPKMKNISDYVK